VPSVPDAARTPRPDVAAGIRSQSEDPYEGGPYRSLAGPQDAGVPPAYPPPAYPPPATAPPTYVPPPYSPPADARSAAAATGGTSIYDVPKKEEKKKGFEWSDLAPENVVKSVKKAAGYGPDEKIARKNLEEGEALFRQKKYAEAIDKFKAAAARWPDSTLEEDAQFLLGESYFFTDHYPKASDTYADLLKKHDNTRYLDTVMAREFAIGRYWEQVHGKDPQWPITPNVTDKTRPKFDTFGYAIKAYETIRQHDPNGPLADDSVMATANAYFVIGHYEQAAYHYDLLRKEYATSEFQPQAHVLGLQAKLRMYQGKDYDGVPLKEAEEIAEQALKQFDRQLGAEKDRVQQTAKEIVEKKAEREWNMGQYYEKKKYFGAARFYYDGLLREYPTTQHAELARARLDQIRDKPDVPPNHFKFLTSLFPNEFE
jgi:outer membrane protein assembly factor BamD (BamD/ComL family)